MAQPPTNQPGATQAGSSQAGSSQADRAGGARGRRAVMRTITGAEVARVPESADPATPILLEFESPSAAVIAAPVPMRSRYITWILASMFAVFIVIAATLPIDRVVVSNGKVVTTARNIVVQPLQTSIVRSINVREGQLVHAGEVLARLDPTFAAADAQQAKEQIASLSAEVTRLKDELAGKEYLSDGTAPGQLQELLFTQRKAQLATALQDYDHKIESARAKLQGALSDIAGYTKRLAMARVVEQKRRELERLQVGSQLNTLAAMDNAAEMARYLASAHAVADGATKDIGALTAERANYLEQWNATTSQSLADQTRKLIDAQDTLAKAQKMHELVELKADRDALVLSVFPVSVGSVMQSGDQLITLVPIDSPLELETVMDGRDAGFVSVGDPVTIKFDSFPYYTYGFARGTVRVVSPDSFRNPNQDRAIGTPSQQRNTTDFGNVYYRTRITIDSMNMHDLPAGFRVTPGMPVTADIKIGKRTIVQFLLSRVMPVATEAMREP